MGHAKQEMEKAWAERYSPLDEDKYVCAHCFLDDGLKEYVSKNISKVGCDYCSDYESSERSSCNINEVLSFISSRILDYYEDPVHSMSCETAEGGYLGLTFDTRELLSDILEIDNVDLQDDIYGAFEDGLWCEKNRYPESDQDFENWEEFCKHVKHSYRFFYLRVPNSILII